MKILQITSELDGGGVDRLLFDYCSRMIPDIQFDFIVTAEKEGILEQPLQELGCGVFHIPQFRKSLKGHALQLREIIKRGKYDAIHDHSGYKAFLNLKIAKACGIQTRIAHSHSAFVAESVKGGLLRRLVTPITKHYATDLFACGRDAGRWMWGEKSFSAGRVRIMTNAIDIPVFVFSEETRRDVRARLGVDGKFVVGNVARFSYQKNHAFLLEIFREIKNRRADAVLLLVGDGELAHDVRRRASALALDDSVIFLGVRKDVPKLLNAMDAFVLPSLFEGLPVTLVEAQAAALPCFAADTITKEIRITDALEYLPPESPASAWADSICRVGSDRRGDLCDKIAAGGYDIAVEAKKMKALYYRLCGSACASNTSTSSN